MDLRKAFAPALPILQALEDAGYEAYAVGGCVRDALRGVMPHDFDLTTNATPEEMLAVFTSYRVHETGLKHGTLTVVSDHTPIEVTTYRKDGAYTDSRHPDSVTFTASLQEDLARRDFTVNAIASDLRGTLCDPFDGRADLDAHLLRCVGNASERFCEDALRILRLFRFSATLGFAPDAQAVQAVNLCAPLLSNIAVERIYSEIKRALCGAYLEVALPFALPIFAQIVPDSCTVTDFKKCAAPLSALPPDFALRFFALCLLQKLPPLNLLRHWRCDNQTYHRVERFVLAQESFSEDAPISALKALAAHLGKYDCVCFLQLQEILRKKSLTSLLQTVESFYQGNPCLCIADLQIGGHDLLHLGFAQGAELGMALERLLHAVWEEKIPNEKAALLDYTKKVLM